jgi:flagellar biosynthesis GTPase FlhF
MADEIEQPTTDEPAMDSPQPETTPTPADLGDAGKKALAQERAARKTAEERVKALEPFEAQIRKLEESSKSDLEKANEARAALEAKVSKMEADNLLASVALSKGVPSAAIKFLSGTTQEELETSADELMALTTPGATPTNNTRPKEKLTPGGVQPENEESLDPGELAKRIQAATN